VIFCQFRGKPGRPKLTNAALRQATERDISAYHHLFIWAAAARRTQEEMVWGTKYSGAGAATPGRWALRSSNVIQSNEKGQSGKQQRNGIANQRALGDSRWYHAIAAEHPSLWA
jgi:hypothetical protein